MAKNIIEDAKAAYNAWRESPPGSYVESALSEAIVRDIVPALIHLAEQEKQQFGYVMGVELESTTEIVEPETEQDE